MPWVKLLRSRNLWVLCIMYFCMSYGWYFNVNYLPEYLKEQHGVQPNDLVGATLQGRAAVFRGGGLHPRRLFDRLVHSPHRQPQMGPAPARHVRPRRLRALLPGVPGAPNALDVRLGHRAVGVLQRSGDGVGLGGLSGHRQALRGHRGRLHEHDRQPRRLGRGGG